MSDLTAYINLDDNVVSMIIVSLSRYLISNKYRPTFLIDEELNKISIKERNEGTKMNPPLQKRVAICLRRLL